eukprot:6348385-Pyramimonas_sp.AAC.1
MSGLVVRWLHVVGVEAVWASSLDQTTPVPCMVGPRLTATVLYCFSSTATVLLCCCTYRVLGQPDGQLVLIGDQRPQLPIPSMQCRYPQYNADTLSTMQIPS